MRMSGVVLPRMRVHDVLVNAEAGAVVAEVLRVEMEDKGLALGQRDADGVREPRSDISSCFVTTCHQNESASAPAGFSFMTRS